MNNDEREKKPENEGLFKISTLYSNVPLDLSHNPHGSIAIDWTYPEGEMSTWANCFQSAAQTLVRDLAMRTVYADREACPIVFLYRHSLELNLKTLLMNAQRLANLECEDLLFSKEQISTHKLETLLKPLKKTFARFSGPWNVGPKFMYSFDAVMTIVRELDCFDAGSFAFRYPVDKSFDSSSLPDHLQFNVFEFSQSMDAILEILQILIETVEREVNFVYDSDDGEYE